MSDLETADLESALEPQGDAPETKAGETTAEVQKTSLRSNVVVMEQQYLDSATLEGRYRLANAFFMGQMVPKSFKNASQVFAGLEFARELGLRPLVGLRNIAVINGSPSIWGDLPLALVRKSNLLVKIVEFLFDEDLQEISFDNKNIRSTPFGAVCKTLRKGEERWKETWFTMDDAQRAGLLDRDNVWRTYPQRMLQMRARSQNLKDNFPDALMGISISEYDYNHLPNLNDMADKNVNFNGTVKRDVAAELNSTLS